MKESGGFYAEVKSKLLRAKEEILRNIKSEKADLQASMGEMSMADPADVVSSDLDKKIIEALSVQSAQALSRVDAALSRIESGTYGVCAKCSGMIGHDRLDVIPEAVLCIACKSACERRQVSNNIF